MYKKEPAVASEVRQSQTLSSRSCFVSSRNEQKCGGLHNNDGRYHDGGKLVYLQAESSSQQAGTMRLSIKAGH